MYFLISFHTSLNLKINTVILPISQISTSSCINTVLKMDGHLIWFSIFSYCAAFRHRPSIPTTTFFGNCCFTNRGIYGSSQSRIQTLLVNKHIWPSLELVVFHRIHCLNYLLSCLAIYTSALSLTTNYNSAINITQTTARVTALGLNESSFQIWEGALFKSLIVHQNWKEKNKIFR